MVAFRERYRIELATGDAAVAVQRLRHPPEWTLTLLTASRDSATSNAGPRPRRLSEAHHVDSPVAS